MSITMPTRTGTFGALVLLLAGALPAAAQSVEVNFVDPDSRIGYATLNFEGDADGTLTLRNRWCHSDSRICGAASVPVPGGFKRFFEAEIKEPVTIELDGEVTILLNPYFGMDARLATVSPMGNEVFRNFQLLQGANRTVVPQPEVQAARVVSLDAVQLGVGQMRVLISDNADHVPAEVATYGSIIQLPENWCEQADAACPGFSFEVGNDLLHRWTEGAVGGDEPFYAISGDMEMQLHNRGGDLAADITQYFDNDRQYTQRFEASTTPQNVLEPVAKLDCEAGPPTIGGVKYHIKRELDDACIGVLSWANVPDPIAVITLANDWCNTGTCGPLEMQSDSFADEPFPTRFWEGQTNRPSLTLQASDQGWSAAVGLFAPEGRVLVRFVNAATAAPTPQAEPQPTSGQPVGDAYKLDDLPGPLGIYAMLEDRTDMEGLGNIGDNLCLFSPVIYPGRGHIWFKELGAPVDGNPYKIRSWMECSRFGDGPENCVYHEGAPDAPNPVASQSGFKYTPMGNGHFQICQADGAGDCGVLYACVGPDAGLTFDREFPAGGRMVDAMLSTHDGQSPGFRYVDNETIQFEE